MHVLQEVSNEKGSHAKHEHNTGRTHQPYIAGEKILEYVHRMLREIVRLSLGTQWTGLMLTCINTRPAHG